MDQAHAERSISSTCASDERLQLVISLLTGVDLGEPSGLQRKRPKHATHRPSAIRSRLAGKSIRKHVLNTRFVAHINLKIGHEIQPTLLLSRQLRLRQKVL